MIVDLEIITRHVEIVRRRAYKIDLERKGPRNLSYHTLPLDKTPTNNMCVVSGLM